MARSRVTQATLQRGDALSQTFFVDVGSHPQGYFVSSIDLFFEKKDTALPVQIELRPVMNGFPSSSQVIPFSEVTLNPADINVPTSPTVIGDIESVPTKATFDSPIHLVPGEYAIVINCNTDSYRLYLAQHGEKIFGGTSLVKKQPYAGSFFKSQNGSTFTPDQKQDLMFKIRRCKFDTTKQFFGIFKAPTVNTNTRIGYYSNGAIRTVGTEYGKAEMDFETIRLNTNDILFPQRTRLTYEYKSTPKSSNTIESTYTTLTPDVDNYLTSTKVINANGSLLLRTTLETDDDRISPVIDTVPALSGIIVNNRMNNAGLSNSDIQIQTAGDKYNAIPTVTVSAPDLSGTTAVAVAVVNTASSNSIERIYFTNGGSGYVTTPTITITGGNTTANVCTATSQGETNASGGNVLARYITRRVNLDEEMEATNIRVYLDAFVHTTAGIAVYFKVKHRDDITSFDDVEYQRMTQRNTVATTEKVDNFKEYEYRSGDPITYTGEDGSRYDTFTSFAIKIVMFGSDGAYPPRIKNFRAIAVD
jgi:hypothetical protein